MASNVETARAFYKAAEKLDEAALLEVLDPDVELWLTEGLPEGLGGHYEGFNGAESAER